MRSTSVVHVLVRLLAAAGSTVAIPIDTSMNPDPDKPWSSGASSDICHRAMSSELNVEVENANERRGFTGLFVVSACLGIYSFIQDTVEKMREKKKGKRHAGSTVVLQLANQPPWDAAGKSNHHVHDTNGRMPGVHVFDYFRHHAGCENTIDNDSTMQGNVGAVHVQHLGQNEYAVISVPKDATIGGGLDHKICVSWGAVTNDQERGGQQHAFIGDVAVACGAQWYWGTVQTTEDDEYRPKCFWIGYEEDGEVTGFQIRPPAFSKSNMEKVANDTSVLCNGVDFGLRFQQGDNYLHTVKRDPAEVIADNKRLLMDNMKRGLAKRSEAHARGLLINDRIQNSAKELCEDPMSMGQDYVNTEEGLFCYMDAKELFPLCHGGIRKGKCFDMKQNHLIKAQDIPRPGMRLGKVPRALHEPYKVIRDIRRKKDA